MGRGRLVVGEEKTQELRRLATVTRTNAEPPRYPRRLHFLRDEAMGSTKSEKGQGIIFEVTTQP